MGSSASRHMAKNRPLMLSNANPSDKAEKSEDVILTTQYKDNPILKNQQNGNLIYGG